jgi:hypothetical protein
MCGDKRGFGREKISGRLKWQEGRFVYRTSRMDFKNT